MAQKHRTNHSKKLKDIEALLEKIETGAARGVKGALSGNWRDDLFEVLMARADQAQPHKKKLAELPGALRREPSALPRFAKRFWRTMKRALDLAGAPAKPPHVAAFGALYLSVLDVFLKDDTRDLSKTMAAVDKRLGYFEKFTEISPCR